MILSLVTASLLILSAPQIAPESTARVEDEREIVTDAQREAVERGLAWLAAHQAEDGSWHARIGYKLNEDYNATAVNRGHIGVTALAGMAFLAGGNLPARGEHGPKIEKALDFILSKVSEDGYITSSGSRMYSHAFATLFLAEIYGMTHREDVRRKLQEAVDFIVKSQNAQGGWRYEPYAAESDMSIVVCQVLALRAARNIGIRVPKLTVDRAARYVVESAVTERSVRGLGYGRFNFVDEVGSFHYQPEVASRSSFTLTAAGVTALHGVGIYSDQAIERGIGYLIREHEPFNKRWGVRTRNKGHYFFWYGHYYAVQAFYTYGNKFQGEVWTQYFEKLRGVLLGLQNKDGSFPNDVGPGLAFGTAAACLILEIPYRFLPIFQR
ncbi:MAG: terpene cyclase/mutase family protein [Planctomycetota bacterium]|nr:terpene cyclase/mutase family protein [Planctomycetota bacterium]